MGGQANKTQVTLINNHRGGQEITKAGRVKQRHDTRGKNFKIKWET